MTCINIELKNGETRHIKDVENYEYECNKFLKVTYIVEKVYGKDTEILIINLDEISEILIKHIKL